MKRSKTEKYSKPDFLGNVDVVSSGLVRDGTSRSRLFVLVVQMSCGKSNQLVLLVGHELAEIVKMPAITLPSCKSQKENVIGSHRQKD